MGFLAGKKKGRKKGKGKIALDLLFAGGDPTQMLSAKDAKRLLAEQRRTLVGTGNVMTDQQAVEAQAKVYRAIPWVLGGMVGVWFLLKRRK